MAGIATTAIDLDAAYKNTRFVFDNAGGKRRYYLTEKFDITQRVEEQALGTRLVDSVCKLFFASQEPERLRTAKGIFTCLTQIAPSVDIEWRIKQVMPSLESARLKESPKDIPKPPTLKVDQPIPPPKEMREKKEEKGDGDSPAAPKERRYAEFTKTCYVLTAKKPETLEELRKLLVEEGLWKQLNVEIAGDQIRFHHTFGELYVLADLASKRPKLRPYFWCSKCSVFDNPRVHWPSDMGLVGSRAGLDNTYKLSSSLLEQAKRHFLAVPSPVKFTFLPGATDRVNLERVYRMFDGLCVGEEHKQVNPKKFLLDNMETLRDLGVKTLFMEHFTYDTIQPLLDHYFDNPGADVPILLQAFCESQASICNLEPPYTLVDILRKAKRCGIRIVGIDASAARLIGEPPAIFGRELRMNFAAKTIIDREKGDGKYLAFMGAGHVVTIIQHPGTSREKITAPGMADLLKCPGIDIFDSHDGKEKPPKLNIANVRVWTDKDWYEKHVHLILERPKPVALPVSRVPTPALKV